MKFRIAIIDDEFFFRNSLKVNMPWAKSGMEVVGDAADGRSGLNLILNQKPDIAIVDINMPVFDGIELIRRAKDAGAVCEYIILTGYDEFKYAQGAMSLGVNSYLLKPVEFSELTHELIKIQEKLVRRQNTANQTNLLKQQARLIRLDRSFNFLVNHQLSKLEFAPLMEKFAGYHGYCVAVFDVGSNAESVEHIRQGLLINAFPGRFHAFIDAKNRIAVLADVVSNDQLNILITKITQFICDVSSRPEIGIGRIYSSFSDIYLSYNEASIAIQNHFIYPDMLGKSSRNKNTALSSEIINRLRLAVSSQDLDEATVLINAIYAEFEQSRMGFDALVLNTLYLISLILTLLSQKNTNTDGILGNNISILSRMECFQSNREFRDWAIGIYQEGIRRIHESDIHLSDPVMRAIEYIRTHFSEPTLSVQQIADALYMNYSYLCTVFKNSTGMTINKMINQERMNRAKAMFDSGAKSITCVARNVGFVDANYFSKCFRKAEGISPSEYIRIIQ